MRVTNIDATTPDGNKYKMTRIGRVVGTMGLGIYGLGASLKKINSDSYVRTLERCAKKAKQDGLHNYNWARKGLCVGSGIAIMALLGFLIGGLIDFVANRISKNSADKKQKTF